MEHQNAKTKYSVGRTWLTLPLLFLTPTGRNDLSVLLCSAFDSELHMPSAMQNEKSKTNLS